ncbi:hypothetical protein FD12_GL001397 [Lentilactobacillus rapi DSM 19907 = JCM 15042]|uniref:Uncharacterized protein n=2 Tax=Lentilactobacillus rapi TaxID=481723 RepID=A0A512PLF8_9LACO|nr:hypothetical protein [Lentilactobacillus rapi]KRL17868.1 hypothetical protein FD12_GL001397 [Lentilactobacillus rapi DSM 19907 = JCM 15042]GEP72027.1 hypothetical protein LRA02_08950 [Lentilactobacillus rapi]
MADRLNVYKKDNLKAVVATGDDSNGAKVVGLSAGAKVADGDYVATHTEDGRTESAPQPVPGWSVNAAKS